MLIFQNIMKNNEIPIQFLFLCLQIHIFFLFLWKKFLFSYFWTIPIVLKKYTGMNEYIEQLEIGNRKCT